MELEIAPGCPECGTKTWFKKCHHCGCFHDIEATRTDDPFGSALPPCSDANAGHYHEIMDRCHIINSMIDDFVVGHPGVDETMAEWCKTAQRALSSVYNRAGEHGDK